MGASGQSPGEPVRPQKGEKAERRRGQKVGTLGQKIGQYKKWSDSMGNAERKRPVGGDW